MSDLASWLGWAAAAALACVAAGWYIGRAQEIRRIERRVAIALLHVQNKHRKELNKHQVEFAKQAQELKEVRIKSQLQEAAERLALAHAVKGPVPRAEFPRLESNTVTLPAIPTLPMSQSVPIAQMRVDSDSFFAPTEPMDISRN